jgi:ribosomal protein S27E
MPTFVKCNKCGREILLGVKRKKSLPPVFGVRCPYHGHVDTYFKEEAFEKGVLEYTCPVCLKRFYITRKPQVRVKRPFCGSILEIRDEDSQPIMVRREYGRSSPILAGALLGGLMGVLLSRDKFKVGD